MKLKKIPYYLLLIIMVPAASTIIGLLSFTGFYAIFPIIPLAIAFFGLSVAYEAEMYLQNIKGALNKLFFKPDFTQNHLAKDFILNNFPKNTEDEDCPQFFRDYRAELELLNEFNHKNLDEESRKRKKKIKKTLNDMEKWFALQLFDRHDKDEDLFTPYERELRTWLRRKKQTQEAQRRLYEIEKNFAAAKIFSLIAGVFMSLGMTYLLVDAFAVLPILATLSFSTLPFLIVPMALIAGAAYTFLIYNAITDMILNDTIRKLWDKITMKNGFTWHNFSIAATAVVLSTLTLALTLCTAGTWWTIAKHARPLFTWIGNLPHFVMGVINPIITGFSQLIFNLENTAESLEEIEGAIQEAEVNVFKRIGQTIAGIFRHIKETENWLQWINLPRLFLKLTFVPLRLTLFLLHLVSIGVTADRVPGIPEIASAILGIICEGFEDLHYFIGDLLHKSHRNTHEHEDGHDDEHEHGHEPEHNIEELLQERLDKRHGHNHDADIPTKLLKLLFWPVFLAAAAWDYAATRLVATPSGHTLSWQEARDKQYGLPKKETVIVDEDAVKPSVDWQITQTSYRIDRYVAKHLNQPKFGKDCALQKITELEQLKTDLRQMEAPTEQRILERIEEETGKAIYNQHRFFGSQGTNTRTHDFLDHQLPSRISAPAA